MAIITISREAGSLGDEIASRLSEELGYKLLNPEMIIDLLSAKGIQKPVIEQFDEKEPGFFSKFSAQGNKFIKYLTLTVLEHSLSNNLIILGLGGPHLFLSNDMLIRVRVIAPEDVRIARISEKYECDKEYSMRLVNLVDHDRRGYVKAFFNEDPCNQINYDLVLNTKYISISDGVELIKQLERIKGTQEYDYNPELIRIRTIVKILYERNIPVKDLKVYFWEGLLTIEGRVKTSEDRELCLIAAQEISGVEEIHNKVSYKSMNNYNIQ